MKIIVAVDGSTQAGLAVEWTAQLPLTAADEIIVTSVAEHPALVGAWGYAYHEGYETVSEEVLAAGRDDARQAAETAAAALSPGACPVSVQIREGHPIQELLAAIAEAGADLIVVGPHGHGALETILLGSVSQALLHAMATSVLVAREPIGVPQRVLLATDGSPHSLAAARFVAQLPLAAEVRIDVLVVIDRWPPAHADDKVVGPDAFAAVQQTGLEEIIQGTVAVLEAGGRTGVPVIRHGNAKREILATARDLDSDLVVTGARGVGGFRGLLLGSVSRAVGKAAPCSTLVVCQDRASPAPDEPG
ncbi:MAG: universal stress protein [Chloroflexi bacterium]|nr:universal stress protein [Chloroflexota bacterium]